MTNSENPKSLYFKLEMYSDGLAYLSPKAQAAQDAASSLVVLQDFLLLASHTLEQQDCIGLAYSCPLGQKSMDFNDFLALATQEQGLEIKLNQLFAQLLTLKRLEKPLIALLQDNSFDLSLSSMLWADLRIGIKGCQLGFPANAYGLYPALGASLFATQSMGLQQALPLLTQGNTLTAEAAYQLGLLDAIASNKEDALLKARTIIADGMGNLAPSAAIPKEILDLTAIENILKKTQGLQPGINACTKLLQQVDKAELRDILSLDARLYSELWSDPQVISMIRSFYFGVAAAKASVEDQGENAFQPKKIGVIGAGMMGAGIAYEATKAGLQVALKDVQLDRATAGKAYAEKLCQKLVEKGLLDEKTATALLARILPTENMQDLAGADLIVEAVFEDKQLKASVTQESMDYLAADGVFASNTTSLPITELAAAASERAADFIGMHFFSPVDRMALVEIICGQQTSEATLAKALQIVRLLGKTPIVVYDGPAFFTSRIFFNYLLEGISMLLAGIPAERIETASKQAGFAVGPLSVLDEISLPLMLHVYEQLPSLHASQQKASAYLQQLIAAGRTGRKSGSGFYDYDKHSPQKNIWQDPSIQLLSVLPSMQSLQQRLLHVVALDSYRCLDEGVLRKPIDGDLGALLGIGYPRHTGGVFAHIDQVGIAAFVADCQSFADFGEQWKIPNTLLTLAARDFKFYTGFHSNWETT